MTAFTRKQVVILVLVIAAILFFRYVCGVPSQDFANWGTLMLGVGTLFLAFAAIKTIPAALKLRHKDKEIISLYQRVVYRMYRNVEASQEGIAFALPRDLPQLTNLLIQKYPQIGDKADADRLMDDLMLDDYFKYVQGNATVVKTVKWNPQDRTQTVDPKIADLPPRDDDRA